MNFKKNFALYKRTTDNKTYKLCHFAHEDMCCMGCVNRRRRVIYAIYDSERLSNKIPNWKLVSKHRKQWMKKPLQFNRLRHSVEISW